jgi:hypothetical protein
VSRLSERLRQRARALEAQLFKLKSTVISENIYGMFRRTEDGFEVYLMADDKDNGPRHDLLIVPDDAEDIPDIDMDAMAIFDKQYGCGYPATYKG